jgi:23S rRNA-/tRNA-specific pseudouridylate synthase
MSGATMQVLHRLDMDTSGVMLLSKDKKVTVEVHKIFRSREIKKEYIAICMGTPRPDQFGPFNEYIQGRLAGDSQRMVVTAPIARHPTIGPAACLHPSGKPAETVFSLLDASENVHWDGERGEAWFQRQPLSPQGACVVQCQPLTGAPSPTNYCTGEFVSSKTRSS